MSWLMFVVVVWLDALVAILASMISTSLAELSSTTNNPLLRASTAIFDLDEGLLSSAAPMYPPICRFVSLSVPRLSLCTSRPLRQT